jgi:O-antigen/teichoic acid export membrane protein
MGQAESVRDEPRTAPGLRRPIVAGVLGKVAEAVTLVLLATLVPRLLGPADYGRLSVALTVVAVGSVALTLGGATLLARYVPAAPPAQRPGLARALTLRLARNRIAPFAVLAVAAAVAVASGRLPAVATAWVLLALALNVAATLALQADLGLGRAAAWSARYPVQNAVLVAAVVALHAVAGLPGAVVAVPVAGAAGLALALGATAALWCPRGCSSADRSAVDLPPDAARFGLVAAGTGALTQLVQRGGVVAASLLTTDEATGHAAVAIGVALAATYAVTQIFVVTLPAFTVRQSHGGGGPHGTEPALRRLGGLLLTAVLPGVALAVLVVDVVVPRVLGPAYADAVAAFPFALAAVVLAPLTALLLQAAALRLRPEATLVAAGVGAAVFVVVALVAVPRWGATGATAATLTGTAATAVTGLVTVPGAAGWRLAAASLTGAAAVTVWSVLG